MYVRTKTRAVCRYRLIGWSTVYTMRMHVELSVFGLGVLRRSLCRPSLGPPPVPPTRGPPAAVLCVGRNLFVFTHEVLRHAITERYGIYGFYQS
jgi:hypothetical protein